MQCQCGPGVTSARTVAHLVDAGRGGARRGRVLPGIRDGGAEYPIVHLGACHEHREDQDLSAAGLGGSRPECDRPPPL
jgi:hypothetical protein